MPRANNIRNADKVYGARRLANARAFMKQALQTETLAEEPGDRAAAFSSAVLAAIAAADAACAMRLGQVWKGEHGQAHLHLRKLAGAGKAAIALQRVVSQKAAVQYMAESVTTSKLASAIKQAQTVLEFAEQVSIEG